MLGEVGGWCYSNTYSPYSGFLQPPSIRVSVPAVAAVVAVAVAAAAAAAAVVAAPWFYL